jgi:hypothetical protein
VAPPPTDHKKQDLRNLGVPVVDEADGVVRALLGGAP